MPIYEYKCPQCTTEFEELVFGGDTPACPSCGAKNSERLLSCACLHRSSSSRVGQAASAPSGGGGCAGCSGGSCSTCG
ncbi:MAG: zinc ribbon domain-containing protein [Desulfovibrio sp.]|jgi:putative FmdB family regulatory protein|nr:zinc ribbon domain-containing protein [Desulfovibrio sp.]